MTFYLISKSKDAVAKVFTSPAKGPLQSRGNGGIIFSTLEELASNVNVYSGLLAEVYNSISAKAVVKFENKETAIRRTFAAIEEAAQAGKIEVLAKLGNQGPKAPLQEPKAPKPSKPPKLAKEQLPGSKGTRRTKVIELVQGAKNPYRVGSLSYKSFEMLASAPIGTTYKDLVKQGIRTNTINAMLREGLAKIIK